MMAAQTNQLVIAKQKLSDALGDRFKAYMNCLKLWFGQRLSKDEFDLEVRKLLSHDTVRVHNEFLLAFFNKCQAPLTGRDSSRASSPQARDKLKKGKPKSKEKPARVSFEKRFVPAASARHVPTVREPVAERSIGFCLHEFCLLDAMLVHGRMYCVAWDYGLDRVDNTAVQIVLDAVKLRMRALLLAVMGRRSAYKLDRRRVQHNLGKVPRNPYLQLRPGLIIERAQRQVEAVVSVDGKHGPCPPQSLDMAECLAALEVAADPHERPPFEPICAADWVEALQVRRNILPSHTVYTRALEHGLASQWHPSLEELRQEEIHDQEEALRAQLLDQQRNLAW
ncbi:transcriptional adapter 1-like [Amblyomma americanum]